MKRGFACLAFFVQSIQQFSQAQRSARKTGGTLIVWSRNGAPLIFHVSWFFLLPSGTSLFALVLSTPLLKCSRSAWGSVLTWFSRSSIQWRSNFRVAVERYSGYVLRCTNEIFVNAYENFLLLRILPDISLFGSQGWLQKNTLPYPFDGRHIRSSVDVLSSHVLKEIGSQWRLLLYRVPGFYASASENCTYILN